MSIKSRINDSLTPSSSPYRWGRSKIVNFSIISLHYAPCSMPYAISQQLDTDRQLNKEGCPFRFIIPDPDISIVVGDDGIDDGEP